MELVDNWLDDAQEIATITARKVHKRYHTYFDVADVVQELWVMPQMIGRD